MKRICFHCTGDIDDNARITDSVVITYYNVFVMTNIYNVETLFIKNKTTSSSTVLLGHLIIA